MTKTTWWKFGVAALAIGVAVAGYVFINQMGRDKRVAAAPARVPVTAAIVEKKDMPVIARGIGTVQAYKAVTVKTRVDGQIVKVSFEEGHDVKAGDQLFQIDPRPFQAALDLAIAAQQRDKAQLTGAQLDLERFGKLIGSGFQSRQSFDQQQATVDSLKASIAADQASIETAKLNLTYADIRSPIDGRAGQRLVDLGNLVQASQSTPLASITQIKPIFVNFTVPQDVTEEIRRDQAEGALVVYAYGSDDKTLLSQGKLSVIDNQIEVATGTLRLKATFENTDEKLWPGEFVNARVVLKTRKDATTVPQRAIMQGASGYYAYIVKPDNEAERRAVEVAGFQDGTAIVDKGLAVGEKVVVDGQYRLTNGATVRIEEDKAATPTADAAQAG
jgi:multidrug efflux system membrane fusion protein